jgi:hypothetical protein
MRKKWKAMKRISITEKVKSKETGVHAVTINMICNIWTLEALEEWTVK